MNHPSEEESTNSTHTVNIDKQKAIQFRQKAKEFEKKFTQMQAKFQSEDLVTYYIISKRFIQQWLTFCNSNETDRQLPLPKNSDLLEPATQELKQGLAQGADFEIVNQNVYQMFEDFQGVQLKRIAYIQNSQKRVPVYLNSIQYIVLKQGDLQLIDRKKIKAEDLQLKQLKLVSFNNKLSDFLYAVEHHESLTKFYTRAWINKSQMNTKQLHKYISKEVEPLPYADMRIKGTGKLIEDPDKKMCDLGMEDGDYLIIQAALYQKWFFREPDQAKCEGCYKYRKLKFICGCKKVGYCTAECQQKDKYYHIKYCSYAEQQQLKKPIDMNITDKSMVGLVGLTNLGNTCFMNSCLQCLSHTKPLLQYFLTNHYQGQINETNPLGSKGKLAKSYAMFLSNMWAGTEGTYSPYRLKASVASINQMFSGYAQHDSQQFFSFLVDGLHEDLNRIQKKPYIESVQSKGRPDHQVALESWLAHVQRNQSIIVDTMTGQYKSKVVCPDCKKQSITFDPFITVTLPIPEEATVNQMSYFVLFNDNLKQTSKMSITYRKADIEAWISEASEIIQAKKQQFKFYILTFNENIYDFQNSSKTQILHKIETEKKNVFFIQLNQQQQALKDSLQLTFRFSKKVYRNQWQSLWFKRPFWFNKQTVTGLDAAKRVLRYLYHDTYDFSEKRYKGTSGTSAKKFEQYEKQMLEQRPFKVFLRYNKTIERFYHRVQTNFQKQVEIQDDKKINELLTELEINDLSDCEIDIKFSPSGMHHFSLDRLRKFSQKQNKKKYDYYQNKSQVNLSQCFKVFEQPQLLQKGNQWYCSNCKDHKLATKQLTIYKAPQILILHFKRFKSKGIIRKEKNDTNVIFPLCLDLSSYVIDKAPMNSYIPEIEKTGKYIKPNYQLDKTNKQLPNYELYGISNHYGGLGGGHYTAYAQNNGKWYCFNDSSVSMVQTQEIKGSGAYMLFYQRKK